MRTSKRRDGKTYYAPEDGDYLLFLSLLRQWVREAGAPINDHDIDNYAQHTTEFYSKLSVRCLRTPKQWVRQLKETITKRQNHDRLY